MVFSFFSFHPKDAILTTKGHNFSGRKTENIGGITQIFKWNTYFEFKKFYTHSFMHKKITDSCEDEHKFADALKLLKNPSISLRQISRDCDKSYTQVTTYTVVFLLIHQFISQDCGSEEKKFKQCAMKHWKKGRWHKIKSWSKNEKRGESSRKISFTISQ